MTQLQSISDRFLASSVVLQDFLKRLQLDMEALSTSSSEVLQDMKEKLAHSREAWSEAIGEYKKSVHNMPRELRQRPFVKSLYKDLEAFEKDARRFVNEIKESPRTIQYRDALELRAKQLAERMEALEENNLVQKFLRGEIILSSKKNIQWGRKIGHAAFGLTFLYLFVFSGVSSGVIWGVTIPFVIWAFSLEIARHLNPRVNDWVCKVFKPVMREAEKTRVNSAIFYIVAMLSVYWLCPIEVAMVTMLYIAVGDPVAGVVGVTWGRRKLTEHASVEGTLACVAVCAFMAAICAGWLFDNSLSGGALWLFALFSGLIGAASEAAFNKIDDNLIMPLLSAPALWVLMKLFAII